LLALAVAGLESGALAQTSTPVFVEDFAVTDVPGLSGKTMGQALAADIQGIIARNTAYLPMTFENLESQLRKEKRAEEFSCARQDQKCIVRILENYGCNERVFGTARGVGAKVQVSLSWFRGTELVPGGTATEYAEAHAEEMSEVAKRLAARLFHVPYESPRAALVDRAAPAKGAGSTGASARGGVTAIVLSEEEVTVEAGAFEMGSSSGETCEKPRHPVTLNGFRIDKYEVTQAQYARFVRETNRSAPSCNWDPDSQPNLPVVCVSWWDAKTYCEWAGRRLPSEAEWEKAARGVTARNFPWGDEPASCNTAVMDSGSPGCGAKFAQPVGSRTAGASPYGAMDMSGNVGEWVHDYYAVDYYEEDEARNNPTGPLAGTLRVVRGGNWADSLARYVRTSSRARRLPTDVNPYVGFRCARNAP